MNNYPIKECTPETLEAVRLMNKFFPESKGFVNTEQGIYVYEFVSAMKLTNFQQDFSCDPYNIIPQNIFPSLKDKGGFDGDTEAIIARLLEHSGFSPAGRCLIIPDARGKGSSDTKYNPIVCDYKKVAQRVEELDCIFDDICDSIFVFENGEAFVVDHDLRFFWAKS
jgi:hypothetical protein